MGAPNELHGEAQPLVSFTDARLTVRQDILLAALWEETTHLMADRKQEVTRDSSSS